MRWYRQEAGDGRPRRCWSDRGSSGSTIIEFALLLPVFSLMLFGMIQFGLVFYGWDALHNGVQAGARLAAIDETQYKSDGTICTYNGSNPSTFNSLTVPAEFAAAVASGGATDAATGALYCQILDEIGTPPGTSVSGTEPAEVNITVSAVGTGASTVDVCGEVSAQAFTGFFPSIGMSSSSEFLVEQNPTVVESYEPYGGAACPTPPTLTMTSVTPTNYSWSNPPQPPGIKASVSLSNSGANSTGSIAFWVYDGTQPPSSCLPADLTGANWTDVGATATMGDNGYTSPNFEPSAPGTYWWYASYSSSQGGSGAVTTCGPNMLSSTVAL